MAEAEPIMGKVTDLFLRSRDREKCKYSEDEIKVICSDLALTLTVWDAVFAMSQRTDLSPQECNKLQEMVDLGVEQFRNMGLSITNKLHGSEKHMVEQIKTTPGGIGPKMEHWMEKYHQEGAKFDAQHRTTKSMDQFARILLKRQSISGLPEVQSAIRMKRKQHTRGKRKATIMKETAARMAKKQRRDIDEVLEKRRACRH